MFWFPQINDVKTTYTGIAEDMETSFSEIYQHACRVARAVDVNEEMPRVASRMTQRSNAPATTPEEYYRRNMAIPFLNHINTEMEAQFSGI